MSNVLGIVAENKIPVKFIGVGEQIDDMEVFNSQEFLDAIIKDNKLSFHGRRST